MRDSRLSARASGLGVVALAGIGCGAHLPSAAALAAAAPPPLAVAGVVVPPGETLVYRVTAGGFDGGRVELAAAGSGTEPGGIAVVRAQIATSGLASLVDDRQLDERTWIDLASGRPLRFRSRLAAGESRSALEAFFDPGRAAIDLVERTGSAVVRSRQAVPGRAALNLYSALYTLRAWSLGPAQPATLDVLARSRLWRVAVRRTVGATIATAGGSQRVVELHGLAWRTRPDGSPDTATSARRFRIYLSADRDRRPLRLEVDARFGVVRAELVGYRSGPPRTASARDR